MRRACFVVAFGLSQAIGAGAVAAPAWGQTLLSSVPAAIATLPQLGEDPDVAGLKRRMYRVEVENEITRVLADAMALRIGTGACDIASTGWAIERGGAEGNPLLGGSRNNALVVVGTKVALLVGEFFLHRRKGEAYKVCMMRQYDGREVACPQLDEVRRSARLVSLSRLVLCGWNVRAALGASAGAGVVQR